MRYDGLVGNMRPVRTKTELIHARVDPKLKNSAERILSKIGISTTEAIRLFLKQVELHRGLPFAVAIPNADTIAAMKEAAKPSELKRYRSFRDLRDRL
jgi:DNA-damage-inducible protein J